MSFQFTLTFALVGKVAPYEPHSGIGISGQQTGIVATPSTQQLQQTPAPPYGHSVNARPSTSVWPLGTTQRHLSSSEGKL